MNEFKTFKTKKRNWSELVRSLNYGGKQKISTQFYQSILKKIKDDKTDGVIINYQLGTIGLHNYFIPFLYEKLNEIQKKIYERLEEEKRISEFNKK